MNPQIPLVDLKAQLKEIRDEILDAVTKVIDSTSFVGGAEVAAFEKEFAAFCGVRYAVGVGNGTDALALAMRAAGIGKGDEVIVPANTFIATAEAVTLAGAKVVFCDVDEETFNISPDSLRRSITPKTRTVLPVHLYGRAAPIKEVLEIASKSNIIVIEDCAQAHGAEVGGVKVGGFGLAGCFSFYPGKNLGAYGDGGAVVTNDEAIADKVRRLADHGRQDKYFHACEGVNSRLDAIQAAILRVKLRHLGEWTLRRRAAAARYTELLKSAPVKTPNLGDGGDHVFHLYVILSEKREALVSFLRSKGVGVGIHYPVALHLQPAYSYLGCGKGSLPGAEKSAAGSISLPMFAEITEEQVAYVAAQVKEFFISQK